MVTKPSKKPVKSAKPAAKALGAKKPAAKSAPAKAAPAKKSAPVKPAKKPETKLEKFKAAEKAKAEAAKEAARKAAEKAKADAAKKAEKLKAEAAKKTAKAEAKAAKTAEKEKGKKGAAAAAPLPAKAAKAAAVKPAPKKPGEADTPGDADSPLLDMSDVGVRKMIAKAKARGYVTYDELNKVLPSDKTSSEQIEDTMAMLNEMGINVIESEEAEEGEEGGALVAEGSGKALATTAKSGEQYDRTDDPVRMYLREMGSVELLSREGEIAIAKRIEAGRELMIGALCESPLTFEALTVWRDELNEGKVLLRDIIDLEAMYGGGPDANAAQGEGGDGETPPPVPGPAFKASDYRKTDEPKPEKPKPAPKAEGEEGEGGEAAADDDNTAGRLRRCDTRCCER